MVTNFTLFAKFKDIIVSISCDTRVVHVNAYDFCSDFVSKTMVGIITAKALTPFPINLTIWSIVGDIVVSA